MPERKITYLGPSDLARNSTDVPRRENIELWWKPESPFAEFYFTLLLIDLKNTYQMT